MSAITLKRCPGSAETLSGFRLKWCPGSFETGVRDALKYAIELPVTLKDRTRLVLQGLVTALEPARLHFGWRTIDDVLHYLSFHAGLGMDDTDALDAVVYAKVLPKLRGDTSPRFEKALADTLEVLRRAGLKRCEEKVKAMQQDLEATGSARYWR